jgi:hypothetical protein
VYIVHFGYAVAFALLSPQPKRPVPEQCCDPSNHCHEFGASNMNPEKGQTHIPKVTEDHQGDTAAPTDSMKLSSTCPERVFKRHDTLDSGYADLGCVLTETFAY